MTQSRAGCTGSPLSTTVVVTVPPFTPGGPGRVPNASSEVTGCSFQSVPGTRGPLPHRPSVTPSTRELHHHCHHPRCGRGPAHQGPETASVGGHTKRPHLPCARGRHPPSASARLVGPTRQGPRPRPGHRRLRDSSADPSNGRAALLSPEPGLYRTLPL